jgi:serine/threonine-protein kinase
MFLDEASLLAQLHHPGIAQIFDLGHIGGVYYLAMEYVPGFDLMTISLEHERQGELIAPELCARIVADAARALHSAHEAVSKDGRPLNLVHRDVTPHNILLSMRGEVKVIDFGVARASTTTHRTQAGYVKGKYPYMSPEQITGSIIDRRVDVYALGLVLYELLTNVRAIAGQSEVEQIDNARSGRIRPIEQLRPNTPLPLRQIVASCLYPDPAGRYPTALALTEDLEKYLAYERHVVGQEDLLRLFRVVAAEALPNATTQPVPPVSDNELWLRSRPTEREQPMSAVVVPDGDVPTQPPEEGAELAFATTTPSLRAPAAEALVEKATGAFTGEVAPAAPPAPIPLQNVVQPAPPTVRWPLFAGLVVVLMVVAGVASWVVFSPAPSAVVDAGTPEVARFVFPEDASVGTDEPEDAGLEEAQPVATPSPFVDAGEASAGATLRVTSEPVADVLIDKRAVGRTPLNVGVDPGTHVVRLVNKAENFQRSMSVRLEPGDKRTIAVNAKKGTLRLQIQPFARITINGSPLGDGQVSFREVAVWEGTYQLEFSLTDASLPAPRRRKETVTVAPDEVTTVNVNLLNE